MENCVSSGVSLFEIALRFRASNAPTTQGMTLDKSNKYREIYGMKLEFYREILLLDFTVTSNGENCFLVCSFYVYRKRNKII